MQFPRDRPSSQPPSLQTPVLNTLLLPPDTKAKVKKKVRSSSFYRLFPGCSCTSVWLSYVCNRNGPSFFVVTVILKVSFEERFELIYPPPPLFFFDITYLFRIFFPSQCICTLQLKAPIWQSHDVPVEVSVFLSIHRSVGQLTLQLIVYLTLNPILLRSFRLILFMLLYSLLPHAGHGPRLPWSSVTVGFMLDLILLLWRLSLSYHSHPCAIFV